MRRGPPRKVRPVWISTLGAALVLVAGLWTALWVVSLFGAIVVRTGARLDLGVDAEPADLGTTVDVRPHSQERIRNLLVPIVFRSVEGGPYSLEVEVVVEDPGREIDSIRWQLPARRETPEACDVGLDPGRWYGARLLSRSDEGARYALAPGLPVLPGELECDVAIVMEVVEDGKPTEHRLELSARTEKAFGVDWVWSR